MATSGTTAFAPALTEIFEEAFERATTREIRTGYEFKTVMRSYNFLMMEWQNRGYNLWTVESVDVATVADQVEYDYPDASVDIVYLTYARSSRVEAVLKRLSMPDYASVVDKTLSGVPKAYAPSRGVAANTYKVYPVPSDTTGTLTVWYTRRIEDGGTGVNTPDVPAQFLPALVAGLAYHIAGKVEGGDARRQMLRAEYDELFDDAASEHRDKAGVSLVPTFSGIY